MTATPLNLHHEPIGRRPRIWGAMIIAVVVGLLAGAAGLWSWQADEPALIATLSAPPEVGGGPLFKARLEPRRHRVMLTPLSPPPQERRKRSRELWLTPPGGLPHSAGLIDPSRTSPLPLSKALLSAAKAKGRIGVSLEPVGGSPTGLPTGPMIAEGPFSGR